MGSEWQIKHVVFTRHALIQMFARAIRINEVKTVISRHQVVAEYSGDQPCPSRLLLGFSGQRPLHVVLGYNSRNATAYVVTAYQPDLAQWEPDFKRRRKK